jgi:hypothetical protein
MALVYSRFHTRKNFSENCLQFGHVTCRIVANHVLGRKRNWEYGFEVAPNYLPAWGVRMSRPGLGSVSTPRYRGLHGRITFPKLIKKLLGFYGIRMLIIEFILAHQWFLWYVNPARSSHISSFLIHLISHLHLCLPSGPSRSCFWTIILWCTYKLSHAACFVHPIHLNFIIQIIFDEEENLWGPHALLQRRLLIYLVMVGLLME